MSSILDLRGMSCPIPLIKTKDALTAATAVTVIVDELPPKENILRFAKSQNYKAECKEENGEYIISISK